jgi:hypothetical protein
VSGTAAVASLAALLGGAIILLVCVSRYLGRFDVENEGLRSRNAFMESFTKAISRPVLRGADLVRGMRSWGKD